MRVDFHRTFRKQFKRFPARYRVAFEHRLQIFLEEPFASELNNHSLSGKWEGYRSINVTGDLRAIYLPTNKDVAFFIEIGTHHELYGS